MFYDLASTAWGPEEIDAIAEVVASGRFTMGPRVAAFERAFAAKFGVRHAVMVNSGSSANLVAVAALSHLSDRPLAPGDEVIVPAIAWATTYSPLQQYGLTLRFVDVDLETLNLDPAGLEAALTPRTRMVVAVSILGNPAPLDDIAAFCDRHGLYLFEDNCESMGADLRGRLCGTWGRVNTFSTFFSHHLSTAEGGLVATDADEIDRLARVIRNHGWERDGPEDPAFPEAYRFVLPGYNVRPVEIAGAVGLTQLGKLDAMVEIRRRNAALFQRLFRGDERFILQREHGRSSWFGFTVVLNPALQIDRAPVLAALRDEGIAVRMITGGCFLRHEAIRHFDYTTAGPIVNANIAHDHGFFVGNHPRDLATELTRLREVLDRAAVPAAAPGGRWR